MRINVNSKKIIAALAVAVCVAGIVFFHRHISRVGAEVETDLFSWVPSEADAVVYASAESAFPKLLADRCQNGSVVVGGEVRLSYVLSQGLCKAGFPNTETLLLRLEDGSQLALCRLSAEAGSRVEQLLRKVDTYQPDSKSMHYGQKIISISPLPDGTFLSSVQVSPCLWAVSFQHKVLKRLLDDVNNVSSKKSSAILRPILKGKNPCVWLRRQQLSSLCQGLYKVDDINQWHTFRMVLTPQEIQLEGYEDRAETVASESPDTPVPFTPLAIYPDTLLPGTTWCFEQSPYKFPKKTVVNHPLMERQFADWLVDSASGERFVCHFQSSDTLHASVVTGFPVSDIPQAERTFRSWLRHFTGSADAKAFYYHRRNIYPLYKLPALSGCTELLCDELDDDVVWMTLDRNWLLFAPSRICLLDFLNQGRGEEKASHGTFEYSDWCRSDVAYLAVSDSLDSNRAENVMRPVPVPFLYESLMKPAAFAFMHTSLQKDNALSPRWIWRFKN